MSDVLDRRSVKISGSLILNQLRALPVLFKKRLTGGITPNSDRIAMLHAIVPNSQVDP